MKTKSEVPKNIDEYISACSPDAQEILQKMRATISKTAPDAEEKISYQMPTFYLSGNLVHFAAYNNHIGFYPTPSGISTFQDELEKYKTSKGAIKFPIDEPLPLTLINKIVKFRGKENLAKAVAKKNK